MVLPVDPARYGAFLAAMFVMAITPGPANLFAIATGMEKGKGAALLGVVGMNCATLIWFVGSALGLGSSPFPGPSTFWPWPALPIWSGWASNRCGPAGRTPRATRSPR